MRQRYREGAWDVPVMAREPLGKRLGRFVALVGVVFAISAGFVVSQRLSSDSLALLLGLSCGVGAMLPTLGLGFWLWRREDQRRQEQMQQRQQPQFQQPPVIVVTPQALPGQGQYGGYTPQQLSSLGHGERDFRIVGGEQ